MRRVLPVIITILSAALSWAAAPVEPNGKLKDKLLDSAGDQKEKIRALARKGVPYLATLLKSERRIIRSAALMALGAVETDGKKATALLVERCNGKDTEDAYFALIALARRRAPEAKGLIPRFVKSPKPRLRGAACFAIWEYGDRTLHPLLDKLQADADRGVQGSARMAKGLIRRRGRGH